MMLQLQIRFANLIVQVVKINSKAAALKYERMGILEINY